MVYVALLLGKRRSSELAVLVQERRDTAWVRREAKGVRACRQAEWRTGGFPHSGGSLGNVNLAHRSPKRIVYGNTQ